MTVGILLLLAGALMVWRAWAGLRRARGGDGGEAARRLRIVAAAETDPPRLSLIEGERTLFGPVTADWAPAPAVSAALGNPDGAPGRLGGAVPQGSYRLLGAVDLAQASPPLREAIGPAALVLERVGGGPPILLHGRAAGQEGSSAGIALEASRFAALLGLLGDAAGLPAEIQRRRVRRSGFGQAAATRRRGG